MSTQGPLLSLVLSQSHHLDSSRLPDDPGLGCAHDVHWRRSRLLLDLAQEILKAFEIMRSPQGEHLSTRIQSSERKGIPPPFIIIVDSETRQKTESMFVFTKETTEKDVNIFNQYLNDRIVQIVCDNCDVPISTILLTKQPT